MDKAAKPSTPDRSHIAPVRSREELIYMLTRACELEHTVSCVYLFAAYSLKTDASEGGLTPAQAAMTRRWKHQLIKVSREEMLHLAQLTNILTAIGGAPHFQRPNFPLRRSWSQLSAHVSLDPFSEAALEHFMDIEMPEPGILSSEEQAAAEDIHRNVLARLSAAAPDLARDLPIGTPFDVDYATQGEFYHKIMAAFDQFPKEELFIGPPEAQAKARHLDFGGQLFAVVDAHPRCDADRDGGRTGRGAERGPSRRAFLGVRTMHAEYQRGRRGRPQSVASGSIRFARSSPIR